jgi:hypothetical protein
MVLAGRRWTSRMLPSSPGAVRSLAIRSSRSGTPASICSSETSAALIPPTCMVVGSIGSMTATVPRAMSWW